MPNMGEFLLPLVVAKKGEHKGIPRIDRYAGVSFYIENNGLIATCGHIIDEIAPDEILVAKELTTDSFLEVKNIKRHKTKDFAVGTVGIKNHKCIAPFENPILPGQDVRAFGFTSNGKSGVNVNTEARLFKGHIVRTSSEGHLPFANSICEVSFPSLSGFSGAPLITEGNNGKLIGMLYNNSESTIQVYGYSDVNDEGKETSESIFRVVELGLAHTITDIRIFIEELKGS